MATEVESAGPVDMTGYIKHHLTHLSSGDGFNAIHLDSVFFKLLIAAIFLITTAGLGFVSQFQSLAIEHGVTAAAAPALL